MSKRSIFGLLKLAISLGLIAYLLQIVDIAETFERLKSIELAYIAAALVLLVVQIALSTWKWRLILAADNLRVRYLLLLKSNYIGNFFSLFLPSSFGGDVYRVVAISSAGGSLGKTTSSVLFDRISGLFALVTIAMCSFLALPGGEYDLAIGAAYLLCIACFIGMTTETVIERLHGNRFRAVSKVAVLLRSFRRYSRDFSTIWRVVVFSLIFQSMIVVINAIYAQALSIDIGFASLLIVIPLIYLTEALPLSVNGIGVRDTAFVYFFILLGHTSEEGLAMALLVLVMRYISGLVGGTILLVSVLLDHFRRPEVPSGS